MGGRLIIVDDEPVILDLFRAVFEGEPYDVLSFATGNEAAEEMKRAGWMCSSRTRTFPMSGGLSC